MKKKRGVQVFAILALLGIIISIVGTGILILTTPEHQPTLTQDELQKILENSQVEVNAETADGISVESINVESDADSLEEVELDSDTIEVGTGEVQ